MTVYMCMRKFANVSFGAKNNKSNALLTPKFKCRMPCAALVEIEPWRLQLLRRLHPQLFPIRYQFNAAQLIGTQNRDAVFSIAVKYG